MQDSNFQKLFDTYSWEKVQDMILGAHSTDVENVLHKVHSGDLLGIQDFGTLISPVALEYLETIAKWSQKKTKKRFGNTIQMFVPMYLSNECQNICTYCGFSMNNEIPRKTLSKEEMLREAEVIRSHGYEHILLVTGEANKTVGVPYMKQAIEWLKPYFAQISLEVQPLEQTEYLELMDCGLHTVLVYQETYRRETYQNYHPKGKKSLFDYRLDTPDRLGKAGAHKIGLGCLLGLENWRVDSFFTALHLSYLRQRYWKSKFSISFPRLRPNANESSDFIAQNIISDKELVQLIGAYRLFDENVELSLSTRESPKFRDGVIPLGITSLSAGSKTNPGGYSVDEESLEQFEISDERSPAEMTKVIRSKGYEVVWKDWDGVLQASSLSK
jgi:2-iminoacetate synthase